MIMLGYSDETIELKNKTVHKIVLDRQLFFLLVLKALGRLYYLYKKYQSEPFYICTCFCVK